MGNVASLEGNMEGPWCCDHREPFGRINKHAVRGNHLDINQVCMHAYVYV